MKWYGVLKQTNHFKFFKSCLPQISLSPFWNTLSHLSIVMTIKLHTKYQKKLMNQFWDLAFWTGGWIYGRKEEQSRIHMMLPLVRMSRNQTLRWKQENGILPLAEIRKLLRDLNHQGPNVFVFPPRIYKLLIINQLTHKHHKNSTSQWN